MRFGAGLGREHLPRRRMLGRVIGRLLMDKPVFGVSLELFLGECAHLPRAEDLLSVSVSFHAMKHTAARGGDRGQYMANLSDACLGPDLRDRAGKWNSQAGQIGTEAKLSRQLLTSPMSA